MEANIAAPAALIADPTRAAMLSALLDGRAQPAGALAWAANVSAQAASNHLAKLTAGGLLKVETAGRHRYYRLASPEVAHAVEALACLAPPIRSLDEPRSPKARALRQARSCYGHLAGRLGVALTEALEAEGLIAQPEAGDDPRHFTLTEAGRRRLAEFGLDAAALRPRPGLARRCLDWTERRHHLAGPLGVALFARMVALGWIEPARGGGRAVRLTAAGAEGLRALGLDPAGAGLAVAA